MRLPFSERNSRPSPLHIMYAPLTDDTRVYRYLAYRSRTCCISGGVQGPRVGHISVTNGQDTVLQPVCRIRPPLVHFPGRSFSFYSRGSPASLSVPLLSAPEVVLPRGGGRGGRTDGGSLEVSLTILRNFADSLARVDHVRPALRSHGSAREGEAGFSRGSEGSEGRRGEGEGRGQERRAGPGPETRPRVASAKGSFTTVSQDMHT